jgi:hypothetical protein
VPRVYVVPEDRYAKMWGAWPENDEGKQSVAIELVSDVTESPHRLPIEFANKLYAAGESGVGYCIFTVVFDDGFRLPVLSGNAIDFIDYPPGKSQRNVVDGLPHIGQNQPNLCRAPSYHWCLYSDES